MVTNNAGYPAMQKYSVWYIQEPGGASRGACSYDCNEQRGHRQDGVSTVSLAAIAAKQGWRTLIVDADHQGNALMSFGGTTDTLPQTVFEVLTG